MARLNLSDESSVVGIFTMEILKHIAMMTNMKCFLYTALHGTPKALRETEKKAPGFRLE